jgi:hypothetical protein
VNTLQFFSVMLLPLMLTRPVNSLPLIVCPLNADPYVVPGVDTNEDSLTPTPARPVLLALTASPLAPVVVVVDGDPELVGWLFDVLVDAVVGGALGEELCVVAVLEG